MKKDTPQSLRYPELNDDEIRALHALKNGEATEWQQTTVLRVIIHKFARTNDINYVPDSPDQSTFLQGRAFVGKMLQQYLNADPGDLLREGQST